MPSVKFICKLVHWKTDDVVDFTLNIDGCLKGNLGVSGAGGIVRDGTGRPLFAFSAFLGQGSSLRAETLAVLIGLRLCW